MSRLATPPAFRPTRASGASQPAAWSVDALEWEELPSLADSLAQRLVMLGERHGAAGRPGPPGGWAATMPAELQPPVHSEPFREVLTGLATREVNEPDVFHHFFGAAREAEHAAR